MPAQVAEDVSALIGAIPYRLALAGGWIDQPFISRLNPTPPGSMVVVGLEPIFRFMDRCGMGTSTREAARALWGERLPEENPADLIRALYHAENAGKAEPSGSQDMAGLVYPGVSRLDYDTSYEGGVFPVHVESCCDAQVAAWLQSVIWMVPVNQRPAGYWPLGVKKLDPQWVRRLGDSGKSCFAAISAMDLNSLGESMNACMAAWEALLPHTVQHKTIPIDLTAILQFYQRRYAGAMYSGCGGGYLVVASRQPVPGAIQVKVRLPHPVEKVAYP